MSGFPINVVHLGELAAASWPKDTDTTFWCDSPNGCPVGADLKRITAVQLADFVRGGLVGEPPLTMAAGQLTLATDSTLSVVNGRLSANLPSIPWAPLISGQGTAFGSVTLGQNLSLAGAFPNQTLEVTIPPPPPTGVTQLSQGNGIALTPNPITGTGTIALANTGVTAGTYQGLTIDAQGRVTSATNQGYTSNVGTVTSITAGAGLSGGTITGSGTITLNATASQIAVSPAIEGGANVQAALSGLASAIGAAGGGTITAVTAGTGLSGGGVTGSVTLNLANTAVTPGSYTFSSITVDAQGRITAASSGTPGGGGIPEPTVVGNFLRSNTGTWVPGLPLTGGTLSTPSGNTTLGINAPSGSAVINYGAINASASLTLLSSGYFTFDVQGARMFTASSYGGIVCSQPVTLSGDATANLQPVTLQQLNARGGIAEPTAAGNYLRNWSGAAGSWVAGLPLTGGTITNNTAGQTALTVDSTGATTALRVIGAPVEVLQAGRATMTVGVPSSGDGDSIIKMTSRTSTWDGAGTFWLESNGYFSISQGTQTRQVTFGPSFVAVASLLQVGTPSGPAVTGAGNLNIAGQLFINGVPMGTGGGTGTVTSIATGTGLTGGSPTPITATGTIALANTTVTPGTYQGITVDQQGRITGATNQGYTTNTGTVTSVGAGTGITIGGTAAAPTVGLTVPVAVSSGGTGATNLDPATGVQAGNLLLNSNSTTGPVDASQQLSLDGNGGMLLQWPSAAPTSPVVTLRASRGTFTTRAAVQLNDTLGSFRFNGYGTATAFGDGAYIDAYANEAWTNTARGANLRFYANDVGGMTTPNLVAEMRGEGGIVFMRATAVPVATAWGPYVSLRRSRAANMSATPGAVQSGDQLGSFNFDAYYSTTAAANGAAIYASATQNWTASARGTQLSFYAVPNNATAAVERFRIEGDGSFAILGNGAKYPSLTNGSPNSIGFTWTGAQLNYSVDNTHSGANTRTIAWGNPFPPADAVLRGGANGDITGSSQARFSGNSTWVLINGTGQTYYYGAFNAGAYTSSFGIAEGSTWQGMWCQGADGAAPGQIGIDRVLTVGINGLKPGGGLWGDTCDRRLKRDVEPFRRGLAEILRLAPVSYERVDTVIEVPDEVRETRRRMRLPRPERRRYVALTADDVKPIMPECVGTMEVRLNEDDKERTEVLTLDPTPIFYAALNALKELDARLRVLEGER